MMVFASLHVKLPSLNSVVCAESHQTVGQVRNLGVTMDVHLIMEAHIKFRISS